MPKSSWRRRKKPQVVPYRNSNEALPKIKKRHAHKVCFVEYGNDYDPTTGKWTLFLDVVNGNPDLVDYVGMRFSTGETHNIRDRAPLTLSDGLEVRRFSLQRPHFPDCKRINITLFGRGGTMHTSGFRAQPSNVRERAIQFLEWRPLRSYYVPPPSVTFGIELEMSLPRSKTPYHVVEILRHQAGISAKYEDDYRAGKKDFHGWKLVEDNSTSCSISNPDCNLFELVSPILKGQEGLEECQKVLAAIQNFGNVSVNKSMGFHVHVGVSDLTLEERKNVCLNFIKYEEVIDTFMPVSRRRNRYCQSNRDSIPVIGNGRKHNAIASCQSLFELCHRMNPQNSRYFKLNLQNLRSGRQETMEFRQHSGTCNFAKVEAWVRFCTLLVRNSTVRPKSLKPGEDAFELLFDTLIRDIKLKDYYKRRKEEIHEKEIEHEAQIQNFKPDGGRACCDGCSVGHGCQTQSQADRYDVVL